MDFAPTADQEQLRQVVRGFLVDRSPEAEVRRLMDTDTGYDPAVWKLMAGQLDLQGLAVPAEYGGAGYGLQELGVVLEEMGRALLCAPYLATAVLAVTAVLASGDAVAQRSLLPELASGSLLATVANTEGDGQWGRPPATTARPVAGGWSLSGEKVFVLDGQVADVLLVSAGTAAGPSLFQVAGTAAGITRTLLPTLDLTRKQARVTFADTPATLLGAAGDADRVLAAVFDVALAGIAAEEVGVAARTLEMAVEYAKLRVQFGRPIGSFQAIKHKLADMLISVESARSVAWYACWAADHAPDELPVAASLAKAYCSDAAFLCAAESVQVHGGIGFTWEHPAHLYFRRAQSSQVLFGSPRGHRDRVADHLGL